jgi:hypothetical protein
MKVWLDRDTCESNLSACLSCFGQFVRTGSVDRGCILAYEEDGSETLTIFMHSEGQDREPMIIPKEMRDMVAYEGWDKFVSFEPSFNRNEGADHLKEAYSPTNVSDEAPSE